MRVVIGCDHAGYDLKEVLKEFIVNLGYEVIDVGTDSRKSVDYPDFSQAVGEAVLEGRGERGIIVCGSGVGASIAANKIPDIRAGICHDCYSAAQGVEHDNMNVLALGARIVGHELAKKLVQAYLEAQFSGEERHVRRVNMIKAIEAKYNKTS